MKTPYLIVSIATTIIGGSTAFAFAELARGEVVLSTTAREVYDSRVFGGINGADDYIFTLDPRLIYRREAGRIKLEAMGGVRINRYQEFQELDSEDLVTSVKIRLPAAGATLASGVFESSYDEHTDVNYDVNLRLREKTFYNHLAADIPISLKTVLLLGGSFREDQRNAFSDRTTWDGTAGFRYQDFLGGSAFDLTYRRLDVQSSSQNEWSIPLDQKSDSYSATFSRPVYHNVRGSITYGYRILNRSEAEVFNGGDRRSAGSLFGLRLDGPFLPESMFPKLESSLMFGYQKNETPGINDTSSSRFIGTVHVGWHARERTRLYVDGRRALELSVNNLTVQTTGVTVGVNQSIGNFTSTSLSAGYEQRDYRTPVLGDRSDDVMTVQAGAHYRITSAWSANANYQLRKSQSSVVAADYARHVVSLEATYTF
jgi:opacity protein-like surface antigen